MFEVPDLSKAPAYYPFKSEAAKTNYLEHYDRRSTVWPVPSETRMVKTSYGETFVRISGPTNGSPLVLLPSTSASGLMWMPNVKALSEEYRVYAVDNIYDYGRSVNRRNINGAEDMVAWLDGLFTELALGDSINLMGLSFGGWLTSQYTLSHPQRLNRVIWVAPVATVKPLPGEWAWRGILSALPHRYFMKTFMMDWLFEDLCKMQDKQNLKLIDDLMQDAILGLKSFVFRMPVMPTVLTDVELEGIEVKTLFLVGENEKLYSAGEAVSRLNQVAPQLKTEIIPNAGHDLTLVQLDLVNSRILEFLRETPRN
ncbi:alpha/beta hydrolase [bacterium]|nr:alpha/beta hydrolase [bacterium]